jgi:hypothetical protein
LRAYLFLFTGARHISSVSVGIARREQFAVLTLSVLIIAAGLVPQPGVTTREAAAMEILKDREFRGAAPRPVRAAEGAAVNFPAPARLARAAVAQIDPRAYDRSSDRKREPKLIGASAHNSSA